MQACGSAALGPCLLTRRLFGRLSNDALGILGFVLTNRRRDPADIEVMRLADVLSDAVQLVDDGISSFHPELSSRQLLGVQIVGGVQPGDPPDSGLLVKLEREIGERFRRLATWRHQLHGGGDYEIARAVLRAIYGLRDAIIEVRVRAFFAWELEARSGVDRRTRLTDDDQWEDVPLPTNSGSISGAGART